MKHYPTSLPVSQQGVVLLEALIGVLIFSLGLLALTGLQARMISNTDDAKYRAEASFVAQQRISEIWLNENEEADITGYAVTDGADENGENGDGGDDVGNLPNGKVLVDVTADSCLVTVTVNWQAPSGDQHTYLTNAVVKGVNWCTT